MIFEPVRDLSDMAVNILQKRYFDENETSWENDLCKRVIDHVWKRKEFEEEKQDAYDMLANRYFIPNSPTLVNSGKRNGGLIACFVVDFPDTIEGIYKTKLDFALIAKKGGGCGTSLSKIRPENSPVAGSTHGYAGGPVKFYDTICHDMEAMTQAGFREMAMMGVMSVYHPDIKKFITAKSTEGKMRTTNISVSVDDEFMKKVEADEKYWTRFKGIRYEELSAKEIFNMIVDGAWKNGEPGLIFYNRVNDSPYKYSYQEIVATNPCFHPDTLIETENGRIPIKDITKEILVYSVDEKGELVLRKASPSWISNNNAETLVIKFNNNKELCVTPNHKILTRDRGWVEAKDLSIGEEVVALCRCKRGTRYSGIRLSTESNRDYRMEHRWIYTNKNGWFDDKKYDIHHIDSDSYNNKIENLELLTHSEHSTLTRNSVPNNHMINGKDGKFISTNSGYKKPIVQMPYEMRSDFPQQPRVVSILKGDNTCVYDISVEGTHNVIANYIVAHNCGEQALPPNGCCNLGSIDLSKFFKNGDFDFELFEKAIRLSVKFLDQVIDVNKYPTHEIKEWAENNRPVGLGIMGLADLFLLKKIAYGSKESLDYIDVVLGFMKRIAENESEKLGELLGVPFACSMLPIPRRNITVMTVAPTGTISLLAGSFGSGCEPVFSEFTTRKDMTGTYQIFHPDYEQEYFRCAVSSNGSTEVTWKEHILVQTQIQKYIDSGVSKTINFPNGTRRETIGQAFILAWKLGAKGITVYRNGSREVEVLSPKNLKKDKCPLCGSELINESGCKHCSQCDFSVCEIA